MTVTETALLAALATVQDPHTGTDYVSTRAVRKLRITPGTVAFEVVLGYPAASLHASLQSQLQAAACRVAGVETASVHISTHISAHTVQRALALLPGVKNIVAIFSGKGGVGKSTVTANLALALHGEGARVGILDADIYGPSQPAMMGISDASPDSLDGKSMQPLLGHGVQLMSIGFLVRAEQAMIWRGPMATQALEQLLRQTHWQDLDYLLVDMPPGTGDIPLTLAQRVPLTGAVAITTPQDIALLDARKGIAMFEKVGVPVLGLIENMATHVCTHCGHREPIFGSGGGQRLAQACAIAWLGALPLALSIREHADSGTPTVLAAPHSEAARTYISIARAMAAKIACQPRDFSAKFPPISVQPVA